MHDGNNTLILFTLIYIWWDLEESYNPNPAGSRTLRVYLSTRESRVKQHLKPPLVNQVKRTALHIDINSMAVLKLINLQPNVTKLSLTSLQYKVSFYSKSKVP